MWKICFVADMGSLIGLPALPRLIHQKSWVLEQWQQCSSCEAAFDEVAEVRNSPRHRVRIGNFAWEAEFEIQTRFLGHPKRYFTTESGSLNQVAHIWAYESFEDRHERRRQLWAASDWVAYAD